MEIALQVQNAISEKGRKAEKGLLARLSFDQLQALMTGIVRAVADIDHRQLHLALLKLLYARKLHIEILELDSCYFEEALFVEPATLEKLELTYKYFARAKNHRKAYQLALQIAKVDLLSEGSLSHLGSFNQRVIYCNQAVQHLLWLQEGIALLCHHSPAENKV